ncbi:MAG TPA: PHB depolymerase family esterase [Kofleriaceae bacterium]|nr:PHB depolymerase family esterase [Kofleriaceae bacterium]
MARYVMLVLALLAGTAAADADKKVVETAATTDEAPCEDCVFIPAKGEHRPLLVLVHGDSETALKIADAFRDTARARDIAIFAPSCPKTCPLHSFWRGNPDPSWIGNMVDELVKKHSLDPDRVWIGGWSGGASYVGYYLPKLAPRYAAVALMGGGAYGGKCAKQKLPVWMLAGDKSWFHAIVKRAHERIQECKHEHVYKLFKGKDHDDEWKLVKKAETQATVLDFLEAHPRATKAATSE